ncbi:MAG: hypothetical protein Q8L34_05295 [Candidatus Woesearchaeota archaeon]|nr:hypothetical protein [Candidatus Woesearchaeota archaeon]
MASTLGNAIQFLQDFGLFDVILPFLLVFTLVFAVLEKTKIFGTEGSKDKEQTRKNLNAMVAFSVAFFVTASVSIVSAFQIALPWVALVLVIIVSFMLLVGIFFGEGQLDFFKTFKKPTATFMVILIVVVLIIFLAAFGQLGTILNFFTGDAQNSTIFTSVIFLLLLVAAMWFVIGRDKKTEEGGKSKT